MKNVRNRKTLMTILMAFCVCAVLPACSWENTKRETTAAYTHSETEADISEPVAPVETSIPAEGQNESETSGPAIEDDYDNVKFNVETYTADHVEVEYIQVADLYDIIQGKLNENIMEFYLWQWTNGVDSEADRTEYYGTATYAFVGEKLLSVQRYLNVTAEGAAYSVNEVSAQTFDVTTGEPVGALNAVPFTQEQIQMFKLTLPSDDVPDELAAKAEQAFKDYVLGTDEIYNYFLTDTGVAIYVMNDVHAECDYFIFEADVADIAGELANPIKSAFGI